MYLIRIDEENGIVNNAFKTVKTYKVLGIPLKKYTLIKRDDSIAKGLATGRLALDPQRQ